MASTNSQDGAETSTQDLPPSHDQSPTLEEQASHTSEREDLDATDEGLGDMGDAGSTVSLTDSICDNRVIHGRTFQISKSTEYWQPNDDRQNDGLDMVHHCITMRLGDKLYKAPIGEPSKVLDVGTGTGIWAIDMADAFPSAEIIGFDISPIQPNWVPPNCEFHIDDAQLVWTWAPESFDFIHMRMLYGSIDDWVKLYTQAYNALVPGGYLESFELNVELESDVPAVRHNHVFKRWAKVLHEAFDRLGKTARIGLGHHMRDNMKKAGFEDIVEEKLDLPCGGWSSDRRLKEVGHYNLAYMEESLEGLALFLLKEVMGWDYIEIQALVGLMKKACRDTNIRPRTTVTIVYGRKPCR